MSEGLVKVRNVLVDIDALYGIDHHCDPALCRGEVSCCGRYEIALSEKEIIRAMEYFGGAAEFATNLKRDSEWINPFEPAERGLFTIDTNDDFFCVFAYLASAGETLCSLHSAALQHGTDPFRVKPRCCTLWPLALSSSRPRVLTIQDDAFDFPCNRKRRTKRSELPKSIATTIGIVFGEGFLKEILRITKLRME